MWFSVYLPLDGIKNLHRLQLFILFWLSLMVDNSCPLWSCSVNSASHCIRSWLVVVLRNPVFVGHHNTSFSIIPFAGGYVRHVFIITNVQHSACLSHLLTCRLVNLQTVKSMRSKCEVTHTPLMVIFQNRPLLRLVMSKCSNFYV